MSSLSDIETEEIPSTSTHRTPIKKCVRKLKTPLSFDDTRRTFFFDPPHPEITPPKRVMPSRKRARIEDDDDDVIIPATKRFCPSKRRPPPSCLKTFGSKRQCESFSQTYYEFNCF